MVINCNFNQLQKQHCKQYRILNTLNILKCNIIICIIYLCTDNNTLAEETNSLNMYCYRRHLRLKSIFGCPIYLVGILRVKKAIVSLSCLNPPVLVKYIIFISTSHLLMTSLKLH